MAWVAVVVMVAAAAYAAYSQREQAKAQKEMYEYQSKVDEYNRKLAEQSAASEAAAHRKKVQRLLASQRARLSAAGLDISSGSPLELLTDTAYEGEMDAQRILYTGKLRGMGFQMSSELSLFQGRAAKSAGNRQATATLLSGAASAAGTGAQYYGGSSATTTQGESWSQTSQQTGGTSTPSRSPTGTYR